VKHLRSIWLHYSVCDMGYWYPSSIALTNKLGEVTCRECLATVAAGGSCN
jgi:hypothetical protein